MSCFPTRIFEEKVVSASFACQICQGITRSPVSDSEGRIFGNLCFRRALSQDNQYERYNSSILETSAPFTKFTNNIINKFPVKCLNCDTCGWRGTLENLEQHLAEECLEERIRCPGRTCKVYDYRKFILEHQRFSVECLLGTQESAIDKSEEVKQNEERIHTTHRNQMNDNSALAAKATSNGRDFIFVDKPTIFKTHIYSNDDVLNRTTRNQPSDSMYCPRGKLIQNMNYNNVIRLKKRSSDSAEHFANFNNADDDNSDTVEEYNFKRLRTDNYGSNVRIGDQLVKSNFCEPNYGLPEPKDEKKFHGLNRITGGLTMNDYDLSTDENFRKIDVIDVTSKNGPLDSGLISEAQSHLSFNHQTKGIFIKVNKLKNIRSIAVGNLFFLNKPMPNNMVFTLKLGPVVNKKMSIGCCQKQIVTKNFFEAPSSTENDHGCFLFCASGVQKIHNQHDMHPGTKGNCFQMFAHNIIEIRLDIQNKILDIKNLSTQKLSRIMMRHIENLNDLFLCVNLVDSEDSVELMSPLKCFNKPFKFDVNPDRQPHLRLSFQKVTLKISSPNHFALLSQTIVFGKEYKFLVQNCSSGVISIGFCDKESVFIHNFEYNENVANPGSYLFASNGLHSSKGKVGWFAPLSNKAPFEASDLISIKLEKESRIAILKNITTGVTSSMNLNLPLIDALQLYPCANIGTFGDRIQLIDE
jgi:hypothetical protein